MQKEMIGPNQNSELPLLVEVWAPWCLPCRKMRPVIKRLEEQYKNRVKVLKVNVDEDTKGVQALGIYAVPTILVYRAGEEVARRTGALPQDDIRALFELAYAGAEPPTRRVRPSDRLVRVLAAGGVSLIAVTSGPTWWLLAIGGFLFFSAVYDRCPIWQALVSRLKTPFMQIKSPAGLSGWLASLASSVFGRNN